MKSLWSIRIMILAISLLAGLITIFGFIVTCIKLLQGDWQKRKVIAWLFNSYSFELPTWAWVGSFLLIVVLSAYVFWLIVLKLKLEVVRDENAIRYILKQSWDEMKNEDFDTGDELYFFSDIDKQPFKNSLIFYESTRLKSGSAKKYFPEIIRGEENYEIVSIGKDTITIRRNH